MLHLQAISYFLDTTRMGLPTYFSHFLDVLRSDLGKPLLTQLAASPEKIAALLTAPADPNQQVQNQHGMGSKKWSMCLQYGVVPG